MQVMACGAQTRALHEAAESPMSGERVCAQQALRNIKVVVTYGTNWHRLDLFSRRADSNRKAASTLAEQHLLCCADKTEMGEDEQYKLHGLPLPWSYSWLSLIHI